MGVLPEVCGAGGEIASVLAMFFSGLLAGSCAAGWFEIEGLEVLVSLLSVLLLVSYFVYAGLFETELLVALVGLHSIVSAFVCQGPFEVKAVGKEKGKGSPSSIFWEIFRIQAWAAAFSRALFCVERIFLILVAVHSAAEALSMLISSEKVILLCVGHAFVRFQQQAAAAWFLFYVAIFCVWFCAGQWHVLGLRIQRAAHAVEMIVCARLQRPSFLRGHVLGLRCWEATHGASSALCDRLVATTPSPLDVITAFGTRCASATPRVDVDAVMTGLGESLWLENMQSYQGGNEKEEEERKEISTEKKDLGCVPVYIRSLTGRTLKLLISPHDDVLTLLSLIEGLVHIPRHLWYARANGKPLPDPSMPHGLLRDDIVTMHGRLAGGAPPPSVPGEWFCQVCQRGGCWPVRTSCFRCGRPRKECEAVNTPHVVPPRERQFPGRAPARVNTSGCPTERKASPQGARKQTGGNDKAAVARMVLEALSCLDLDGEVLNKIRAQLVPPPPPPKPSRILADLEVKIDKAQNELARLQKVVVTKQAELHQADERANCKAKEVRELHAEMMRVKKEVIQVAPPTPPPTPPPKIPVVLLTGDDGGGDDCEITPMAQEDDAFLGLHHGAFEVHDMEDEDDENPDDDCSAQVKRVKATPSLTFEETCKDIGSGRFNQGQLAEIVQIASMQSDILSQGTVG